jgi:acyl CoA:acetate/3-ketoacid CoA transferase beta subunit
MGGAMDLVSSVKRVICLMALTDKYGDKKFRPTTDLPVTGPKCVSILISNEAVFEFTPNGVVLKELARGVSLEKLRTLTDVDFRIADKLGVMEENFSSYEGGNDDEDIFK